MPAPQPIGFLLHIENSNGEKASGPPRQARCGRVVGGGSISWGFGVLVEPTWFSGCRNSWRWRFLIWMIG